MSNNPLGTCSRKLPLVESGFSSTSLQKRVKLVRGTPIRTW